jgi:hypothetical protein
MYSRLQQQQLNSPHFPSGKLMFGFTKMVVNNINRDCILSTIKLLGTQSESCKRGKAEAGASKLAGE